MTVTTSDKWEHRLSRTIYFCGTTTEEYVSALVSSSTISDNPKESRPKPADPSWLSPTPQAKQYTKTQNCGLVKRGPYLGGTGWCGGASAPKYVTQWYSDGPFDVYGSGPPTNWQLKMRLDIKDQAVNLGASLAEYRDTARMFRSFAEGVHSAWKIFRGRLPRRSRLTPCTVAAAELTTSFGIMPLANDLYDSFYALQGRLANPVYRRFVSRDTATSTFSAYGEVEGKWEVSERAIAYVELEPNRSDFTLGNPLEIGWEVVPFSFVVDWAIPVGDYLSSLDALKDVKSLIGTVTRKERYYHRRLPKVYQTSEYVEIRPFETHYESHERTVIHDIPVPQVPSWDPSTSWKSIMHGISLLTAINQRCRR